MKGFPPYYMAREDAAQLTCRINGEVSGAESLAALLREEGNATLSVSVKVRNYGEFLAQCHLDKRTELVAEISGSTAGGAHRRVIHAQVLDPAGAEAVAVSHEWRISRADVQGDLRVKARILLRRPGARRGLLVASRCGAILWEAEERFSLAETDHVFPIVIGTLTRSEAMVPWHVELCGDPDQLLPVGMRIILNEERREIWQQLDSDQPDCLLLEWFLGDVFLSLLMDYAFRVEEQLDEVVDEPERSSDEVLWRTVRELEEGVIKAVLEMGVASPEAVRERLQEALRECRRKAAVHAKRLTASSRRRAGTHGE